MYDDYVMSCTIVIIGKATKCSCLHLQAIQFQTAVEAKFMRSTLHLFCKQAKQSRFGACAMKLAIVC